VVFLLLLGLGLYRMGLPLKKVPLLLAEDFSSPLEPAVWQQAVTATELAQLVPDRYFSASECKTTLPAISAAGLPLTVYTSIDPELQKLLQLLLHRYKPQIGAGVLLDLESGAISAMAEYRHADEAGRIVDADVGPLCLTPIFPAASLFKIVTAYGVMEKSGVAGNARYPVIGRYHTLYKYQLGLATSRYRFREQHLSLEEAFARSVNPIFGRFGVDLFDAEELLELGRKFAFNRPLEFDLELPASKLAVTSNPYRRAEAASGFIKSTTISPLHAALLVGMPVAEGRLLRPYLVERVVAADGGEMFYRQEERPQVCLEDQKACVELVGMMRATVKYGTASKSFQHLKRKKVYADWDIGGKTGSLDMPDSGRRCEWFAGFGKDPRHGRSVAAAVVLVHGELRTISSAFIAAEMLAAALQ